MKNAYDTTCLYLYPIRGVRSEVVKKGRPQDLDILVHDEDVGVRFMVAKHGRWNDLDILMYDEDADVRYEVARRRYPKRFLHKELGMENYLLADFCCCRQ